jgi:hypothetical protein
MGQRGSAGLPGTGANLGIGSPSVQDLEMGILAPTVQGLGFMKKPTKKLVLNKESLRKLSANVLPKVGGGRSPWTQSCHPCQSDDV